MSVRLTWGIRSFFVPVLQPSWLPLNCRPNFIRTVGIICMFAEDDRYKFDLTYLVKLGKSPAFVPDS